MLTPFVRNRIEIIWFYFTVFLLLGGSQKKIGGIVSVQVCGEHSFVPDLKADPIKMFDTFRIGKGECDFDILKLTDHDAKFGAQETSLAFVFDPFSFDS